MAVRWQLFGVAVAITLAMFVSLLLTSRKIMSLFQIGFIDLFKPIITPFIANGGAVIVVLGIIGSVRNLNLYSLFALMLLGLAVYSALSWASHRIIKLHEINVLKRTK
jgi:hypothetical protein